MRYVRDVPRDDDDALEAERAHVTAYLSAAVDGGDDPDTNAGDVWVTEHPEDPGQLRVVGEIDGEPNAPYLKPGYDPFAGVDPELLKEVRDDGPA